MNVFVERTTALADITPAITLAMAKDHLRVDHDDEDTLIERIAEVAAEAVEDQAGRCLTFSTWRETHDNPTGTIELARYDASTLSSIERWNATTYEWTALDAANFYLENNRLCPRTGTSWPSDRVRFSYVCGYSADTTGVPFPLIQAVLLVVAELYENRMGTMESRLTKALFGVDYLIGRYRRHL